MTEQSENVWVHVADEEIIVTLPSSRYKATFYKPPPDSQYLSLKDLSSEHDPRAPLTPAEFLGQAWEAATEKARELGVDILSFGRCIFVAAASASPTASGQGSEG